VVVEELEHISQALLASKQERSKCCLSWLKCLFCVPTKLNPASKSVPSAVSVDVQRKNTLIRRGVDRRRQVSVDVQRNRCYTNPGIFTLLRQHVWRAFRVLSQLTCNVIAVREIIIYEAENYYLLSKLIIFRLFPHCSVQRAVTLTRELAAVWEVILVSPGN